MVSFEELVRAIGSRVVPARELREALAISPATLSRLVGQASDQIFRIGRARSAAYARTRALPEIGSRAPLYRIGSDGKAKSVGELIFLASGGTFWAALEDAEIRFEGLPP